MRMFAAAACAIILLLAGPPLAAAQAPVAAVQIAAVNPGIAALLAQFSQGGPALRAAIAAAIEADPSLAADVAAAAGSANPAQKEAICAGLADAASYFLRIDSTAAQNTAALIQAAVALADAATRSCFGTTLALNLAFPLPGLDGTAASTSGCVPVSPSRPGQRC